MAVKGGDQRLVVEFACKWAKMASGKGRLEFASNVISAAKVLAKHLQEF